MRPGRPTNVARARNPLPGTLPAPAFSDEALLLTDAPVPGRTAPPATADLQSEVITDWSRLEALGEEWQDLASAAAEPHPVYQPWMLLPALRAYRPPGPPEGLVASPLHRRPP